MRVEGLDGLAGLVKYWWLIRPKTVTHSRGGGESNSQESQVRHSNQKTKPLAYRKRCSSQFAVQLHSLVTNEKLEFKKTF